MAISNIFNTTAGSNKLFVTHLHKRALNALYGQAVLYEQGDAKPLPGGSGTTMIIPKYVGADNITALTEGTLLTPTSAAMANYSGTVAGYGEVRAYSDFIMAVNEIPQFISDEINDMTMYARKKLDAIAQGVLSASSVGTNVSPDGGATTVADKNILTTTTLRQRALFDANSTLAGNDANPYGDGCWHGVFHPSQIHDLFVNAAASGNGSGFLGAGYMEQTDAGAKKLEKASIGILGNVKIWQSTWGSTAVGSAGGFMSAGVAGTGATGGWQAYIMAPGAFAKVDLATSRLRTYWNPAKASTYDSIEQVSTAGVKFYATAVAMDTANRLCKIVSGGATF